jgi:hypothetical protein
MGWFLVGKETKILIPLFEMPHKKYTDYKFIAVAYTLDEILDMLPDSISKYHLYIDKNDEEYDINYAQWHSIDIGYVDLASIQNNTNPAEAAGQLLAWCIEHGYVKPEKLNQKENNDEKQ